MSAYKPWTPVDLEVLLIESFDNSLYVQPKCLALVNEWRWRNLPQHSSGLGVQTSERLTGRRPVGLAQQLSAR